MRLSRLLVLAVAMHLTGCGLIDAAGDTDDSISDNGGDTSNGPHMVTFSPAIVVTDVCGLAQELEVDGFVVEVDGSGAMSFQIDDASGSFVAAVFSGELDGISGLGDIDCDPSDPDPPFLNWTVNGSPEDGFFGTYAHDLDGAGDISIVAQ